MASEDLTFSRGERCRTPEHQCSPLSYLNSLSQQQSHFENAWNHDETVEAANEHTSTLSARPSTPTTRVSPLALPDILRSGFRTPERPTQAHSSLSPPGFNDPAWYPTAPSQTRSILDLARSPSADLGGPLWCPTSSSLSESGRVGSNSKAPSPSYRPVSPIGFFYDLPCYSTKPFRSEAQHRESSPSYGPSSPAYYNDSRTDRTVLSQPGIHGSRSSPSNRPESPAYFPDSPWYRTDRAVPSEWEHIQARSSLSHRPESPAYSSQPPWCQTVPLRPGSHIAGGASPSYRPRSPTVFDDSPWYRTDRTIPSQMESDKAPTNPENAQAPSRPKSDKAGASLSYVPGLSTGFHTPLWYGTTVLPPIVPETKFPTPPPSAEKNQHHLSGYQPIPKRFWYISSQATHLALLPTLRSLSSNPQQFRGNPLETLHTSLDPYRFEIFWSNPAALPDPRGTIIRLFTTHASAIQHAREHEKHLQQDPRFEDKDVFLCSISTGCLNWTTTASAGVPSVDLRVLTTIPYLGAGMVAVISGSEARRITGSVHVEVEGIAWKEEEWFALGKIPEFMFDGTEKFEPASFES